ncbi:hypothetical protein ACSBR1_030245 [Camellia fascicularis]
MGVNPSEGLVRAKSTKQAMVVNPIDGLIRVRNEPRFKPKGSGSLIPPKRRLVKQMMFESIVQAIASCFHSIANYACNNKKKIRAAQSDSSSLLNAKP